jgi:hypothetical protein
MDEKEFRKFLKRGGRSQSAVNRVIKFVQEFEEYLGQAGKGLDQASPGDLESFVAQLESVPKSTAKKHLWGIRYYYEYSSNEEMQRLAGALRQQRIKRKPFALKDFRGVNPQHAAQLEAIGIKDVAHMLKAGRTPVGRQELAQRTGVPLDAILEFVKLSDLARLAGVKGIRARLYYDAGVDTLEKMAQWDPQELRAMLVEFVERTGFDGIASLPKEARGAVHTARKLPKIVEY